MFAMRDGGRVAVLRPRTKEEAKRSLDEAKRVERELKEKKIDVAEAERQFNQIIANREFIYVGFLSRHGGNLLDKDGKNIGKVEPGDSFIPESDMEKLTVVGDDSSGRTSPVRRLASQRRRRS